MNIFALFSLLSTVISFILGIYVYSQDNRGLANKLFILLCLSLTYWTFTEFCYRQAGSYTVAYFWMQLNCIWPVTITLLLHFVLEFTEHAELLLRNKVTYILVYSFAGLAVILDQTLLSFTPVKTYWGWTYSLPNNSLWFIFSRIWAIGICAVSLLVCVRYYVRVSDRGKKKQTKYVSLGMAIPVIMGLLTEGLSRLITGSVPELTAVAFTLGSVFIGHAIVKYKLVVLTPTTATESITAIISDALLLVNPDGKIISVNQATITLLGYEEKELINQPLDVIFTKEAKTHLFSGNLHNQLKGASKIIDFETTFETKEGRIIPVSVSTAVMRDNEGLLKGVVFIGRNITTRKQAERSLKESEERLNAILTGIADLITIQNRELDIIWVNQPIRDRYGDIVGQKCYRVYKGLDEPCEDCYAEKVFKEGKTVVSERESILPDGSPIHVFITSSPIRDADGNIVAIVEVEKDITERKKLDHMKSQFINMAAHELRTPLSALKAHVDLLKIKSEQGYLELPEEVNEKIRVITRNAKRINMLINDLLDYTRLEAGTVKPKMQLGALESIAIQTIKDVLPLARKNSHMLEFIAPKPLPQIYMDKEQIHTIFTHLISNAIKYTPDSGTIQIKLLEEGNKLHITVKDTGIGIAEGELEKIFQPLYVADISKSVLFESKSEFERAGMGLAIIRAYVEMHGGKIWVKSQVEEGSTFHVLLPIDRNCT